MSALEPLETLYESASASAVDLSAPSPLAGALRPITFFVSRRSPSCDLHFRHQLSRRHIAGHHGQSWRRTISGNNEHDRFVMGILRAVSDVVIVGAGTLRAVPKHVWTSEYIYPSFANAYAALRAANAKSGPPLNVIVTSGGDIDLDLPVFKSGKVEVLIVTTEPGARRISQLSVPPHVRVHAVKDAGPRLSARAILEAAGAVRKCERMLVEGGPQLIGDFFAEGCLDELFLTQSPQIAGRNGADKRPGLVGGKIFAPDRPLWGRLLGIKRAGNHLFVRYSF